ncbi:MAG TPA: hypothetical protein VK132_08915 [Gemmatimonadales bacterium]|nr:hypothetical protein [Gemmatimonadales bacterium]
MPRFYRSVDTVIMGRKTWEIGRRLGQPLYPGKINYVLSRTRSRSAVEGITLLRGSAAAVRDLKSIERSDGLLWAI